MESSGEVGQVNISGSTYALVKDTPGLSFTPRGKVLAKGKGEMELGRLVPGDYFGEGGLFMGSGETGAVHALTATVVYEVGQAALAALMRDRPSIADEISVTLSRRTKVGGSEAGPELKALLPLMGRPRVLARLEGKRA